MTEKRNVRAQEVRENVRDIESRPQASWTPPALLDAPDARPGFVQRWVATSIQGKDTPDNVYKRMREGWEARPASTVKNQLFPTINHGQWEGCIGIEGMLLCEMPIEKHRQMKSYYAGKSVEQNQSLTSDLTALEQKSGQKIYQERKSSVSGGRQVSVMEDQT
tara:strand:- start:732 stop:1220 length:489 start_codon:yes stop_codon:yes gene_type:complete